MLRWFRTLFRLPPAVSSFADGVDTLHLFLIGSTLLGVLVLSLLTTYFVLRYRERAGLRSTPVVQATGTGELIIVLGTLSLFVLWWVIGYRQYLNMRRRPAGAITVYVMAKQWMWKFSHENGALENNVLTIPVGRPVELLMSSRDVIHSFFVPAMRVKQDVLPGRFTTLWFTPTAPGRYPLFCAEYCGISHSAMLGEVHVLGADEYQRFLADSSGAHSLAEVGREAALKHACFSCHTVDGQRHIGPSWSRLYGSQVTLSNGEQVTADAAYLTESMMDPAARVVAGYAPVMPTYFGSLDSSEAAAIVAYIRSLEEGPSAPSVRLPEVIVPPPAVSSEPKGDLRP